MYPIKTALALLILIVVEIASCRAIRGDIQSFKEIKEEISSRLHAVTDWKFNLFSNIIREKKIRFLDILKRIHGLVLDLTEKKRSFVAQDQQNRIR